MAPRILQHDPLCEEEVHGHVQIQAEPARMSQVVISQAPNQRERQNLQHTDIPTYPTSPVSNIPSQQIPPTSGASGCLVIGFYCQLRYSSLIPSSSRTGPCPERQCQHMAMISTHSNLTPTYGNWHCCKMQCHGSQESVIGGLCGTRKHGLKERVQRLPGNTRDFKTFSVDMR